MAIIRVDEDDIYVTLVEESIAPVIEEVTFATSIEEVTLNCPIVEEDLGVVLAPDELNFSFDCEAPGSGKGGGYVFVTQVTGAGIIAEESYVPDTVPTDTVLVSCLTDNDSVTVHFLAEGSSNYSPTITVDGITCTNLSQVVGDLRLFTGSVSITVTEDKLVSVESSSGQTTTVIINRAGAGPSPLTCVIGDYPGTQTAVKQGDTVHVTGVTDPDAVEIRLVGGDAFDASGWVAVAGNAYDITGTVSSLSGIQTATVEARNSIGTIGVQLVSSNSIILDQVVPTFVDNGTTFPATQSAFKGIESGIQGTTVNNADSVLYSSPNGDFSISFPAVYAADKSITCTNPGTYNDSSTNFRIVATKIANDSSATFNKTIEVADTAPVITVTQPQARLRSSPLGATYVITATSDQNLASAPSLDLPVGGTWQGGGFTGGPKIYTRSISVDDSDSKGSGVYGLSSTPSNNAGIDATITGTQVLGGFTARDIELAAFATSVQLGTEVVTTGKLVLDWDFKTPMNFQAIGTSPPVVSGWTIDAININPTTIIILDTQAAAASSQASVINIEEII